MGDQFSCFAFDINDGTEDVKPTSSERWPVRQENGYESGGICNTSEPIPLDDSNETKMLILNLSVDDKFEVYGGAYGCPEPLRSQLHYLVEQIRNVVTNHRRKTLALSESGSSPASPIIDDIQSSSISNVEPRQSKATRPKSRPDELEDTLVSAKIPTNNLGGLGLKRQAPSDEAERNGDASIADGYDSKTRSPESQNRTVSSLNIQEEDDDDADESDYEAFTSKNVTSIYFNEDKKLRDFYYACFRRIQQTACRQIAQVFVKVVHPRKQTLFPYNGNKRSSGEKKSRDLGRKPDLASSVPRWWPEGVPHREPAHMKTPERMKLLLHILCDLRKVPGTGPEDNGVRVEYLRKATDNEPTIQKMPKKVRRWLAEIYHVRAAHESAEDGCKREKVSVHWPSNKRIRRKNDQRRRKTDDDEGDENEIAMFEDEVTASKSSRSEWVFQRIKRNGQPYTDSTDDEGGDGENLVTWRLSHAGSISNLQEQGMRTDGGMEGEMRHSQSLSYNSTAKVPVLAGSLTQSAALPELVASQSEIKHSDPSTNASQLVKQPQGLHYGGIQQPLPNAVAIGDSSTPWQAHNGGRPTSSLPLNPITANLQSRSDQPSLSSQPSINRASWAAQWSPKPSSSSTLYSIPPNATNYPQYHSSHWTAGLSGPSMALPLTHGLSPTSPQQGPMQTNAVIMTSPPNSRGRGSVDGRGVLPGGLEGQMESVRLAPVAPLGALGGAGASNGVLSLPPPPLPQQQAQQIHGHGGQLPGYIARPYPAKYAEPFPPDGQTTLQDYPAGRSKNYDCW